MTDRPFDLESDFLAVRQFLVDTYPLYGRLHNWGIDRWEITRYSTRWREEQSGDYTWPDDTRIWEDAEGTMLGVVHPEDPGTVFVEIHPDHHDLETAMFSWALERHRTAHPDEPLVTIAAATDSYRQRVLTGLGWQDKGPEGYTRRREIDGPTPEPVLPPGYRLATVDPASEYDIQRRAAVAASAFEHPNPIPDRVRMLLRAPSLSPELHLVTVAPDDSYGSYTGVWFDETNRFVVFEPVGTSADHRRLGLASAVMTRGLQLAAERGATHAYVGSEYGSGANRLYERMGFTEAVADHAWKAPI